jgi:transcriptional regulator with XRE-family HTH domain
MERGHVTRVTLPYLRAWRLKRLLSQGELAEMGHVAKSTLARLEKGDQSAILRTVGKLAKALDITREQLVREDPDAPSNVESASRKRG